MKGIKLYIICIGFLTAMTFTGIAWIDLHKTRTMDIEDRLLFKQLVEQREQYHGLRSKKGKLQQMYIRYLQDGVIYFKDSTGQEKRF